MMKYILYIACISTLFLTSCSSDSSPKEKVETPEPKIVEQIEPKTEPAETVQKKKHIVFFGNSLTAAYGLDPSQGFAGLIQERLDSLGLDYRSINAGLSGETTAGGLSRVDWILERNEVAIFILELGGNDGLRGLDPTDSKKNLQGIIDKVRETHPAAKIILAGMEAPPNMGDAYTSKFRSMYTELAKANDTGLIPFLLEGVGGVAELNQRDGIHPTAEGHRIVMENIWKVLKGFLT